MSDDPQKGQVKVYIPSVECPWCRHRFACHIERKQKGAVTKTIKIEGDDGKLYDVPFPVARKVIPASALATNDKVAALPDEEGYPCDGHDIEGGDGCTGCVHECPVAKRRRAGARFCVSVDELARKVAVKP